MATGAMREEAERSIGKVVTFHLEGLREGDLLIPEPSAWMDLVEVQVTIEVVCRLRKGGFSLLAVPRIVESNETFELRNFLRGVQELHPTRPTA
jgi:hypothetical protein